MIESVEAVTTGLLAVPLATGVQPRLPRNEKPRRSGAFHGADDGTRTHDLLHGKQTL
jgi:hypothetical protein